MGWGLEFFAGTQRVLWEFECDQAKDGEGSQASMKGFAIKASILEMVSLGERGDNSGSKGFLDEVGSVDSF